MRDALATRLAVRDRGPRHRCGRRPRRRARRRRCWRAATRWSALDRAAIGRARRGCAATRSTCSTTAPWRRRWPTRRRPAWRLRHVVAIAGGALPDEKACVDPAELPLEVFRRSLEQNLTTAWIALHAALPHLRAGDGRPLDHADVVDRRARRATACRPTRPRRRGCSAWCDSLAATLGADGHPHQRGRARRRADPAQRARVGARARLVRPAARGVRARPARHARRTWRRRILALIDLQHVTGQTIVVDGGQTIAARPATRARRRRREEAADEGRVASRPTIVSACRTCTARCRARWRATA